MDHVRIRQAILGAWRQMITSNIILDSILLNRSSHALRYRSKHLGISIPRAFHIL